MLLATGNAYKGPREKPQSILAVLVYHHKVLVNPAFVRFQREDGAVMK